MGMSEEDTAPECHPEEECSDCGECIECDHCDECGGCHCDEDEHEEDE
jgi:hypothetical protein